VAGQISVGVVVVSWEGADLTASCIESLLAMRGSADGTSLELQVLVVDNGSSPLNFSQLTRKLDEKGDSRVQVLRLEENKGYAAGANHGIRTLLAGDAPDYIWVLNNDVRADCDALVSLVRSARKEPDVLMWGSTILDDDGGHTIQCAGGYTYSPLTTRMKGSHAGRKLDDVATLPAEHIDYVSGAAMFCSASLFLDYGLFCEDYFLYFEEQDMARRLPSRSQLGWCRESLLVHRGAASTSQGQHSRSAVQQYYENLSTLRFTARFYPLYLLPVFLTRIIVKPMLFLVRAEWHLYKPLFAAYLAFILRSDKYYPG